jgi:hypothetical protein
MVRSSPSPIHDDVGSHYSHGQVHIIRWRPATTTCITTHTNERQLTATALHFFDPSHGLAAPCAHGTTTMATTALGSSTNWPTQCRWRGDDVYSNRKEDRASFFLPMLTWSNLNRFWLIFRGRGQNSPDSFWGHSEKRIWELFLREILQMLSFIE